MENRVFVPADGSMPSLENLPTLLQKPIANLKKLSCVAGVISGIQQDDLFTMLLIRFKPDMDYKRALECLNVAGLKAKYLQINHSGRFMKISLGQSKQLLN